MGSDASRGAASEAEDGRTRLGVARVHHSASHKQDEIWISMGRAGRGGCCAVQCKCKCSLKRARASRRTGMPVEVCLSGCWSRSRRVDWRRAGRDREARLQRDASQHADDSKTATGGVVHRTSVSLTATAACELAVRTHDATRQRRWLHHRPIRPRGWKDRGSAGQEGPDTGGRLPRNDLNR